MVVLDTDHLTLFSRDLGVASEKLRARLRQLNERTLNTTIVTYEEQCRGWLGYLSKMLSGEDLVRGYRKFSMHLKDYQLINVVEFEESASKTYENLKRQRIRVGSMDLRFASIALANDAILLSRNLGDFRKIPGLMVEDWSV